MRARVLGAVELVDADGVVHPIGSANQRTVLAVLLAHRGDVVTIDTLIDALWGDAPPPSAVPTLRTYVSRLRSRLGPALASRGGGFVLDLPSDEVDAGSFESLVDAARGADAAKAAELLATALGLWEGPAFGDRADVDSVRAEARRLEARRAAAREAHAAALLAAGRVDEAVATAESLTTAEPLREGGWAVLIESLAAAHRTADALRAFRHAAAALAEAGLEPSGRLRHAERTALAGDAARPSTTDTSQGPSVRPRRFDLPVAASSFVGRDDDVQRIGELLGQSRLVTLTGPGGVGKTRLALEVAHRATECRSAGAFVELAAIDEPAAVADVVVASLGLISAGRPAVETLGAIGALDVLIVLDNAEHVIDAAAATTERILGGGSVARVLVTSRERLSVDGEQVWTVAPLATTGPSAPAAQLFGERAAAVGSVPAPPLVARIVERLDGLPLAIEMAAAQLDVTTAEELADVLDEHLDQLRSTLRRVEPRHRSLVDVLEWSEARLDGDEARTLAELSTFAGPVSAADIEAVLGRPGVGDVVRRLVRRSLVNVDRSRTPARYHLLQTTRTFAQQRLDGAGRAGQLARQHAEWFVAVARRADAELRTTEEAAAVGRLDAVFAELRAAHRWAVTNDLDLAAELTAHLHLYAQGRILDGPFVWAEQLLGQLPDDHPRRPAVLASAATPAIRRGDIPAARHLATQALNLAGDTPAALAALDALVDTGLYDGRIVESAATARTMAQLARQLDDAHYLAIARSDEVLCAVYGGLGVGDIEPDLADLDAMNLPPTARGWVAYARAELCAQRDPDRALAYYADALAAASSVDNRYAEGAVIVSACSLRARVGDAGEALDAFAEAIRLWLRLASASHQLTTLRNLAILLHRLEQPALVAELLGGVDHGDVPTYGDEARRLSAARQWAERELGPERFATLTARGAANDLTAAAESALRLIDDLSGPTPSS